MEERLDFQLSVSSFEWDFNIKKSLYNILAPQYAGAGRGRRNELNRFNLVMKVFAL